MSTRAHGKLIWQTVSERRQTVVYYAISISFEEQCVIGSHLDTRRWEPITHCENKTRLWFYVYAHPLKSKSLESDCTRQRSSSRCILISHWTMKDRDNLSTSSLVSISHKISKDKERGEGGRKGERERERERKRNTERCKESETGRERQNMWSRKQEGCRPRHKLVSLFG